VEEFGRRLEIADLMAPVHLLLQSGGFRGDLEEGRARSSRR
jgi:hypothetical protein